MDNWLLYWGGGVHKLALSENNKPDGRKISQERFSAPSIHVKYFDNTSFFKYKLYLLKVILLLN